MMQHDEDVHDEYYSSLQKTVDYVPSGDILVVIGDMMQRWEKMGRL